MSGIYSVVLNHNLTFGVCAFPGSKVCYSLVSTTVH